jgi:PAS domain S-box-containing protein
LTPDNELTERGVASNSTALAIEEYFTTRQTAEESIREAIAIFQNSSEAIIVTDAENVVISVNPAFSRLTGYRLDEIVGLTPSILNSCLEGEAFFIEMRASLEMTGHWEGEMSSRRKNGEIYAQWRRIYAIYNRDGSIHRWVTLFSDIGPKKKSDELIWQYANFDSLTSLPNRHMFYNRLEQEIKKAERSGSSIALVLLDLDNFKRLMILSGTTAVIFY